MNAFLVDGAIVFKEELNGILADLIKDYTQLGCGQLTLPVLVIGTFEGYVNADGYPCGIFTSVEGEVILAHGEQLQEVAPRLVSAFIGSAR